MDETERAEMDRLNLFATEYSSFVPFLLKNQNATIRSEVGKSWRMYPQKLRHNQFTNTV